MNGKMDLSSAEAVMDLIQSRAQGSRRAALEQLHGALMRRIRENEERLLTALSTLDAAMDYPEEMEDPHLQTILAPIPIRYCLSRGLHSPNKDIIVAT